jgi:hypothetical protein
MLVVLVKSSSMAMSSAVTIKAAVVAISAGGWWLEAYLDEPS